MNKAYNCDCMEYMRSLPDNAFDLAVVDPPYGDGLHAEDGGGKGWFTKYNMNANAEAFEQASAERERDGNADGRNLGGEVRKKIIAWDVAPEEEFFKELFRVSRNQVIWGGNYFALPPTRCFLVWRKLTISENFSMAMAEYAWTSFNANAKVFDFAPQGKRGDPRFHPCLPAETKVFFNGSWKDIETVQIGDKNEFGRVSAITTHDAEKMVIIAAGRKTIAATWNHPFLVKRQDAVYWVNAEQLKKGDELLRLRRNTHRRKKDICVSEQTGQDYGWSIALFGKNITVKFQKVCKFITKTLTRRTTTFPICNLSRPLNTSGCTKVADLKTVFGISRAKSAENLRMQHAKTGIFRVGGLTERFANHATLKKLSKNVVCVSQTVGSVRIINEKTKVYNLTLDGIPAFETEIGITHNTQKPVELYAWIYNLFAKQGDKILDTHLGSGSSRIAAYNAGLDFVGCEIEPYYFQKQEERFAAHTAQRSFFETE